jgi:hypothetical protein
LKELLFDIPETLSPRLRWLNKHGIQTYKSPYVEAGDEPWAAWQGELTEAINADTLATGETEDEAIVNYCKRNGIQLWNGLDALGNRVFDVAADNHLGLLPQDYSKLYVPKSQR